MKVSPGLVRDILVHLGFKTMFRRDMSHGIDLLSFETLTDFIAHSSDGLKQRLLSPKYNNLTSFLRLMTEWANAHPEMLNDALVKSNVKHHPAEPLARFEIKEKSVFPGSETSGNLSGVIHELKRLGHGYQHAKMAPEGLMSYFGNISNFQQHLNPDLIGEIRMGRWGMQQGGHLTADSVMGILKYRSTSDSSIFSSIIDEIRKMLNAKYNIDLSSKSQQRVQEKLEAFKIAEKDLYDSMAQAMEREKVLKATGQQIDIDNAGSDAERKRLIEHYTGMSKLLDNKNRHASRLIKAIQSMLRAGVDYDNQKIGIPAMMI